MKEIFEKYANKLGEARDQSVTWVELLQCLLDVANKNIENVNAGNKAMYSVVEELFKEAEYRRIRSMSFVMAAMGYSDTKEWINAYDEYCNKFDEGNKADFMGDNKKEENSNETN